MNARFPVKSHGTRNWIRDPVSISLWATSFWCIGLLLVTWYYKFQHFMWCWVLNDLHQSDVQICMLQSQWLHWSKSSIAFWGILQGDSNSLLIAIHCLLQQVYRFIVIIFQLNQCGITQQSNQHMILVTTNHVDDICARLWWSYPQCCDNMWQ